MLMWNVRLGAEIVVNMSPETNNFCTMYYNQ